MHHSFWWGDICFLLELFFAFQYTGKYIPFVFSLLDTMEEGYLGLLFL